MAIYNGKEIDYIKMYNSLMNRLIKFRDVKEFSLAYHNTLALLERAEILSTGAYPNGRFGFSSHSSIELFTERAASYIDMMEKGINPLKGKFATPGCWVCDHSVVIKDGIVHLFYNKHKLGYEWAESACRGFGHAITKDLINFEILPDVLCTENEKADEYQMWAPSVIEKDGKYYMLYTGVNYNIAQSTCLAVSSDLMNWEKYPEPVFIPNKKTGWSLNRWSDNRDNMMFKYNDEIINFYCMSDLQPDGSRYYYTGIIKSSDFINWEECGKVEIKGLIQASESPFVLFHNNRWYFIYTKCGCGTCYAISDNPINGWKDMGELMVEESPVDLPFVPSCAEIFEFNSRWYITRATRLPGNEQYIEILNLIWNEDGTITVGDRVE